MSQVYLLLRNNQQSGPYTFEEILKLQLKPFDLVWVNGRSAAWQYPGEISALKPYVPTTPQNSVPFQPIATSAMEIQQDKIPNAAQPVQSTPVAAKNVFVSMPKTEVSKNRITEETVSTPILKSTSSFEVPDVEITGFKMQEQVIENTNTYDKGTISKLNSANTYARHIKTKTLFTKKDMALVALLIGFIAGGYYLISEPSLVQPKAQFQNNQIVKVQQQPVVSIDSDSLSQKISQVNVLPAGTESNLKPEKKYQQITPQIPGDRKKKSESTEQPMIEKKSQEDKIQKNEVVILDKNKEDIEISLPTKDPEKTKNKKIGEVFKNILNKAKNKNGKPNDVAVVLEEPKPSIDRNSVRREEQQPPSSNTTKNESISPDITELIDLTSQAPDSWMMGINGLKVTLRNRSNTLIQTAAVSIQYFDANNNLLDKKLVYFNQIPAKGKLTLPAPDHKWADHTKLILASISTKEDRFAKD